MVQIKYKADSMAEVTLDGGKNTMARNAVVVAGEIKHNASSYSDVTLSDGKQTTAINTVNVEGDVTHGPGAYSNVILPNGKAATALNIINLNGGSPAPAPTSDWAPNPFWPNIKDVLASDTREYAGKVAYLMYNYNDTSVFNLVAESSASGEKPTAVATSDGAFYSYADNGASVTHTWDKTKDFPVNGQAGYYMATRWVVLYFANDTVTSGFQFAAYGLGYSNSVSDYNSLAWLVYKCNARSNRVRHCSANYGLEAIELYDDTYTFAGTNFANFCGGCHSLQKLPDVLDVSQGTNFTSFCDGCSSLTKLPDVLDVSQGTNFIGFCYNCYSLTKLPDVLDVSQGTNFTSFCVGLYSLQITASGLVIDMGNNTTNISNRYSGPLANCSRLKEINIKLYSNSNAWFDMSTVLSIESFRYMADNAPDVTATPRTLTVGSTNLSRINAADPTIITTFNSKGWTVA